LPRAFAATDCCCCDLSAPECTAQDFEKKGNDEIHKTDEVKAQTQARQFELHHKNFPLAYHERERASKQHHQGTTRNTTEQSRKHPKADD